MAGRSRCSVVPCCRSMLTLVGVLAVLSLTGCNRAQPREHWWEFWKPRPIDSETVYHPDQQILSPPPPGVLDDPWTSGESAGLSDLPPVPTMEEAATIPEEEPPRQAAEPVSELHTIQFAFDSAQLDDEGRRLLDQNVQWLSNRPNYEVSIEGHCDEQGTEEYNVSLGHRRARMVRDYLITQGIDPDRLHTISYGEWRPIDPAGTPEAYARNRRVQFLVY